MFEEVALKHLYTEQAHSSIYLFSISTVNWATNHVSAHQKEICPDLLN